MGKVELLKKVLRSVPDDAEFYVDYMQCINITHPEDPRTLVIDERADEARREHVVAFEVAGKVVRVWEEGDVFPEPIEMRRFSYNAPKDPTDTIRVRKVVEP